MVDINAFNEKGQRMEMGAVLEENDISSFRALKLTAAKFGKTPIDVDQFPYSIDWQKELLVDESFYSSYVQQYVKKANSEKLNSWQILANRLKQS